MATKMGLPGMDMMKGVGLGPLNIGNVLDTMGFVKKAWGAMNAPSSFMPTMDVEELNKRIVDLQAVEQWLMMNLSMIQASVQALEVQRATIETLKNVTKGFAPGSFPAAFQGLVQQQAEARQSPTSPPPQYSFAPEPEPEPPSVARAPRVGKTAANAAKKTTAKSGAASTDPGLSATAWLEFLQGQFNQVTQAAMSGAPMKAANKIVKAASPVLSKKKAPASKKPRAGKPRARA